MPAQIYGGSIEVVARPTPADTISLFAEYNDNKYNSFITRKPAFLFNPASTTCASTISGGVAAIDCSGKPLIKAPKWVGSAAYEHRFDLAGGGDITALHSGSGAAQCAAAQRGRVQVIDVAEIENVIDVKLIVSIR